MPKLQGHLVVCSNHFAASDFNSGANLRRSAGLIAINTGIVASVCEFSYASTACCHDMFIIFINSSVNVEIFVFALSHFAVNYMH